MPSAAKRGEVWAPHFPPCYLKVSPTGLNCSPSPRQTPCKIMQDLLAAFIPFPSQNRCCVCKNSLLRHPTRRLTPPGSRGRLTTHTRPSSLLPGLCAAAAGGGTALLRLPLRSAGAAASEVVTARGLNTAVETDPQLELQEMGPVFYSPQAPSPLPVHRDLVPAPSPAPPCPPTLS